MYFYEKRRKDVKFMKNEDKNTQNETLESIEKAGTLVTDGKRGSIQCITVIGQIEGHYLLGESAKTTKYEHIIPLLCQIEESSEIGGLLILLNTVGGDVEAGLAIAELIAGMKKPTASIVLGGGHSIGVPLAVSAKRSFIVPSATMTVHPVRTNGLVVGVPQSFDAMRKMQERITGFVTSNSKISKEKFTNLMMRTDEIATDVGSIIDGEEAVRLGLIDEVGGLAAALSYLHGMIDGE